MRSVDDRVRRHEGCFSRPNTTTPIKPKDWDDRKTTGDNMSLTFNKYQKEAVSTAIYPFSFKVFYPTLGLCGEAGEVAEKIKKIIRDGGSEITDEQRDALKGELGDVMWYLAALANDLELDLGAVAEANLEKLRDRKDRGKLQGSGDNR